MKLIVLQSNVCRGSYVLSFQHHNGISAIRWQIACHENLYCWRYSSTRENGGCLCQRSKSHATKPKASNNWYSSRLTVVHKVRNYKLKITLIHPCIITMTIPGIAIIVITLRAAKPMQPRTTCRKLKTRIVTTSYLCLSFLSLCFPMLLQLHSFLSILEA